MIVVVTEACPQSKVPARVFRPLVRGYQAARPSCDVVQSVWLAMGYPVRLATTFQAAHLHGWVPAESRSLMVVSLTRCLVVSDLTEPQHHSPTHSNCLSGPTNVWVM